LEVYARRPLAGHIEEINMGINKEQIEGRAKEMGGKLQEEFGKVTGNKTQEAKGTINKAVGAGQAKLGDVAEQAKNASKKP
jgi:uncharacterized protein YjbJ (UPF0337 family)